MEYNRDYFVEQGKKGIEARNKKLTKKQLSLIAKKGWQTKKANLTKSKI